MSGILMTVRILVIKVTTFDFKLEASCWWPPKEGSAAAEVEPHPMRAKKRSSDRTATALTRRIPT